MKYTTSAALAALMTIGSAQAAVMAINFELSRGSGQSVMIGSPGTVTNSTLTTAAGGNPQTSGYTITGLTLDSVGSGDDSITFDMVLTGTGTGTVDGFGAAFEAWGVQDDDGTGNMVDTDETFAFSFGGATVTLGAGATETATIAFDGFTGFQALNVQSGETFDITGTTGSDVTGDSVAQNTLYSLVGGLENSFTIEGNTGAMRYYHIGSQVTVTTTVPEPASGALLALGGLALIFRRRR